MPSHPDRVRRNYPGDDQWTEAERRAHAERKAKDPRTGISIRFVREYDVKSEMNLLLARCSAERQGYICDREAGHPGLHTSYNAQVDEPVFWWARVP